MTGLAASEAVARAHAPLVQRAAAILGSAAAPSSATLCNAGEALPPGSGPCIRLERGAANALRRAGRRGHFTLAYRDPAADAPLAALLAALTQPGMPIAADPETLSVLSLADRLAASDTHLPEPASKRLSNIVQISEAKAIMQTLDACGGNRADAARQLGISERTLRYRLAAFREAGLAVAGARR